MESDRTALSIYREVSSLRLKKGVSVGELLFVLAVLGFVLMLIVGLSTRTSSEVSKSGLTAQTLTEANLLLSRLGKDIHIASVVPVVDPLTSKLTITSDYFKASIGEIVSRVITYDVLPDICKGNINCFQIVRTVADTTGAGVTTNEGTLAFPRVPKVVWCMDGAPNCPARTVPVTSAKRFLAEIYFQRASSGTASIFLVADLENLSFCSNPVPNLILNNPLLMDGQ